MSSLIPLGTDEQAKALASIAATTTEGIKTATKAGGWVASILQDVPKDLIGLGGADWLHHKRQRNLATLETETAAHLERIAAERRTEPSPSVLVPLLSAATDESRKELQRLWAAFLANAMIDDGSKVRREFFETLRSLEPQDAFLLQVFSTLQPGVDILDQPEYMRNMVSTQSQRQWSQTDWQVSVDALTHARCVSRPQTMC